MYSQYSQLPQKETLSATSSGTVRQSIKREEDIYWLYLLPIAIIKIFVMRLFFKYVDSCKSTFKEHSRKTLSLSKSLKKKLLSIVFKGVFSKRRDQKNWNQQILSKTIGFHSLKSCETVYVPFIGKPLNFPWIPRVVSFPKHPQTSPNKSGTLKLCSDPEKPDLGKWVPQ